MTPNFPEHDPKERLSFAKKELHRLIKEYYGDKPYQYEMADLLLSRGTKALRLASDQVDSPLANQTPRSAVEAIVHTDGSRPSFFIRNDTVDLNSSPAGEWKSDLVDRSEQLKSIFPRIGRIDDPRQPQGFCGTGFLIHKNLLLTNRHVLQLMASRDTTGKWGFTNEIFVDFKHEYKNDSTSQKRKLTKVVFAGPQAISSLGTIDHKKLDLAIIELEPATASNTPTGEIKVNISTTWANAGSQIYLIGYPGSPEPGIDSLTILERLFQLQFGYKRLAPGRVVMSADGTPQWTFSHDASTLGGNSGSLVIQAGRENCCAGIHYGGRSSKNRVNWGHVLGRTTDATDGAEPRTLKEILNAFDVDVVDI